MAVFLNPVPGLRSIAEMFEAGSAKARGIRIDADLCRLMAETLKEGAEHVSVLVEFARTHGMVRAIDADIAPVRTPAQRQQLARLAVALDPGARVVAFPQAPVRHVAISEGGSAA